MSNRKREMRDSERVVEEYLRHLGIGEVQYEPDGQKTPDFLVDNRIAVEVRWLNEQIPAAGEFCGLRDKDPAVIETVQKVLAESGAPDSGRSWYVCYTIERPFPPTDKLQNILRRAIREFRAGLPDPPTFLRLPSGDLRFIPAMSRHDSLLLPGSPDFDVSGAEVGSELLNNVRLCIEQKSKKVDSVRDRYQEWWLALVDGLTWGAVTAGLLDSRELAQLREGIEDGGAFSRVLLVSPDDSKSAVELFSTFRDENE